MTARGLRVLAVMASAGAISMAVAGFLLKQGVTSDDVFGIPFLAFTLMGLAVAFRQPLNPVGWVFLLVGMTPTTGFLTSAYAFRALQTGWPGGRVAEWISSWAWFPGIGTFVTFGLLLFPDGRLPSRRWKLAAYLAASLIVVITAGFALEPGPMEPFDPSLPSHDNPFGWEAGAGFVEAVLGIAFPSLPLVALVALVSLIFRYRQSGSEQRQQIKWFAYSASVLVLIIAFEDVLDRLIGERATEIVFLFGMVFPSIGAGIGILKYRLYDIDVVINRTLVYGLLTAILAVTYLAIVVSLQALFARVTEESDLAIAASTLAVAALFRPVRFQVQAFIDQRFYRRKYDASATLGEFSAHLRDQVDLQSLTRALVGVVGETMQPAHVSVWIRRDEVSA